MASRISRFLNVLDLEERILNGAALFALISVFFPWLSGEWLGEDYVSYSGFEFFTSFLGITIFMLHLTLLAIVTVPLFGGRQIIRKRYKEIVRLCLASQTTILSLAAISVLTKVTYDYTRMEIRFGIYLTLIGSLVATFYAFWKFQEYRKLNASHEHFHHPEDAVPIPDPVEPVETPMPPPPPPLEPEEHHIRP